MLMQAPVLGLGFLDRGSDGILNGNWECIGTYLGVELFAACWQ